MLSFPLLHFANSSSPKLPKSLAWQCQQWRCYLASNGKRHLRSMSRLGPSAARGAPGAEEPAPKVIFVPIKSVAKMPGRQKGAKGYRPGELKLLLGATEGLCPAGKEERAQAAAAAQEKLPAGRGCKKHRRKRSTLHRMKAPAGNPNCPWHAAQAKRCKHKIGNKPEHSSGAGGFGLEEGFGSGEEALGSGSSGRRRLSSRESFGRRPSLPSGKKML